MAFAFGLASRERLGDARTAQARRSRAKTRSKGGTLRAPFIPDAHFEWDGPEEWTTRRPQRALRWPRSWLELGSQEMFAGGAAAKRRGRNAACACMGCAQLYVQVVEPALISRAAASLRYLATASTCGLAALLGLAHKPRSSLKIHHTSAEVRTYTHTNKRPASALLPAFSHSRGLARKIN